MSRSNHPRETLSFENSKFKRDLEAVRQGETTSLTLPKITPELFSSLIEALREPIPLTKLSISRLTLTSAQTNTLLKTLSTDDYLEITLANSYYSWPRNEKEKQKIDIFIKFLTTQQTRRKKEIRINLLKATIAEAKANKANIQSLTITKQLIYPELGEEILKAISASDHLEKIDLVANVFSDEQLVQFYQLLAKKPKIVEIHFHIEYETNTTYYNSIPTYDLGPLIQKYTPWLQEAHTEEHSFNSNELGGFSLQRETVTLLELLFNKISFTSIHFLHQTTFPMTLIETITQKQIALTHLSFLNTNLPSAASAHLITIITQCQETLTTIQLEKNPQLNTSMPTILTALQRLRNLSHLHLSDSGLDDTAMQELNTLVTNHGRLETLIIDENTFGSLGLSLLARALKQNQRIHTLFIAKNQVTEDGVEQFLREIGSNRAITTLNISHATHRPAEKIVPEYGRPYTQAAVTYSRSILTAHSKLVKKNKQLATEIFTEASLGHMRNSFHKLRQGASPYMKREDGTTLLHIAVRANNPIFVARLIKDFGLSAGKINNKHETPMSLAQASDNNELTIALTNPDAILDQPASTTTESGGAAAAAAAAAAATAATILAPPPPSRKRGRLPAPKANQPSVFDFLHPKRRAAESPSVTGRDSDADAGAGAGAGAAAAAEQPTPRPVAVFDDTAIGQQLLYCSYQGQLTELEALLERQPTSIHYTDAYGRTALHAAAEGNQPDILRLLLASTAADATTTDLAGLTPLHMACLHANLEAVKELIAKSDITAKCILGYGTLFYTLGGSTYPTSTHEIDALRATILRLLIPSGLDINELVNDLSTGRSNVTALHLCAQRGLYKVLKTLFLQRNTNINIQDNQGETMLHYIVRQNTSTHIAMLDRALLEPTLDKTRTNAQGQRPLTLARALYSADHVIPQLLQQMRQLPNPEQALHWAQKLEVTYASRPGKPNKTITIDTTDIHAGLRATVAREMSTTDRGANLAAANIIFVVSDKKHRKGGDHGRTTVKVNLTFLQKQRAHVSDFWQSRETVTADASASAAGISNFGSRRTRSPDALQRVIDRYELAPDHAKTQAVDDIHTNHRPLTANGAKTLYGTSVLPDGTKSYELRYHHGETGLYDHLENPETIRAIAEAFKQDPNYSHGCKVYAIVLNIHSKFYICFDCELGLLGLQNSNSTFINQLRETLAESCIFSTNKPLVAMSLFSAQCKNRDEATKTAADHQPVHVDLRMGRNDIILQQDVNAVTSEGTVFSSRRQ